MPPASELDSAPPAGDLLDSPQAGGAAIRGSALRTGGYGVITLLALISAPLLTRHLGTVGFGRFATIISLIGLATAITDAGLGALAVRELAVLGPAARDRFMRELLGIRVALTVVAVAAAIGFAAVSGWDHEMVVGTIVAGVGGTTYVAQSVLQIPLAVNLRLGWLAFGDVTRQVAYTALIVAAVLAGGGLIAMLATQIGAGLVGCLATIAVARGDVPLRPAGDLRAWRRILRQTLPIAAAGAVYTVYFRLVILLMSLLATAVETGVFAVSFRVIEVLVTVPFLVVGGLMPIFSRAARDDRDRLAFAFGRTFEVAVFAGAGLTLLIVVGAPLAVDVLTGAAGPAVGVLRIQALTLLAVFMNTTYGSVLIAMRRQRALLQMNAAMLAGTVVLAVVLISPLGAKGGAIAATGGEWMLLAGYLLHIRRHDPELLPSRLVLPRALLAGGLALAVTALVSVPVVPRVGDLVIAALVYGAAMLVMRGVPRELLHALVPARRVA